MELVSMKDMARIYYRQSCTIWKWTKEPGFPAPIKSYLWDLAAVQKWVDNKFSR